MTAMGTAMADVMTAVIDGLRGTTGWRDPWDDMTVGGVCVYDTVEPLMTSQLEDACLIVGLASADDDRQTGSATQAVATLGTGRHREEQGTIACIALSQTGDSGPGIVREMRAAAAQIIADVDVFLRANGSLGLVPQYRNVTAMIGDITSLKAFTTSAAGVVCEIDFTIKYDARL